VAVPAVGSERPIEDDGGGGRGVGRRMTLATGDPLMGAVEREPRRTMVETDDPKRVSVVTRFTPTVFELAGVRVVLTVAFRAGGLAEANVESIGMVAPMAVRTGYGDMGPLELEDGLRLVAGQVVSARQPGALTVARGAVGSPRRLLEDAVMVVEVAG